MPTLSARDTPLSSRHRCLFLLGALTLVALLLPLWRPTSAIAADAGPGYSPDGSAAAFVGAMRVEGTNAYCLELDRPSPIGHRTRVATAADRLPADIEALDAATRARLHWVVAHRGSSTDPNVTAAVAMYVWSVADHEHYRGDQHYLSLIPAEQRQRVAEQLRGIRQAVSDVRPVSIPDRLNLTLREQSGELVLDVGALPAGVEAILRVTEGTIDGQRELTLTAGNSKSLRVTALPHATTVTVTGQLQAAPTSATANPQYLVTEGRQLLVQGRNEPWPTATVSVDRSQGVSVTPMPAPSTSPAAATPTATPSQTPPATTPTTPETTTPAPEPTKHEATPAPEPEVELEPAPEPELTPEPTPEPADEPSDSSEPTQPAASEPATVTETPVPTATPTPTATFATSLAEPPAPSTSTSTTPAPGPALPPPEAEALAQTGFDGGVLITVGGVAMTAVGAGGWLVARRRSQDRDESAFGAFSVPESTPGW